VYEIRDNVGSVRVALNRTKVSGQADVYTYNDYFPYGSIARSGGTTYRYDYQGAYAEKDPVTGLNNFDLRMYDGRIGRWLSVDPMGQYASPYEGMGNNPVSGIDPSGGGHIDPTTGNWVSDPTDNSTYAYLAQVTYGKNTYTWMGQDAGWIAEDHASNSTLESMYWSSSNPFQGAYGNQLREWASSSAGIRSAVNGYKKQLDFAAGVAKAGAYAGTGGLASMAAPLGGGATGFLFNNSSIAVKATNAAVSFFGQALTSRVGFRGVDYADVAFDTFGTAGSSAIFDGAVDLQINGNGPQLGVVLINKDIQLGVNQAASNYLINRMGDFKVMKGDAVTPAATNFMGKILQMLPGFN
jgi:RHS repeat-associated protein